MLVSRFSLSALSLASLFVISDCMAPGGARLLTPEESLQYINDEGGFRAAIEAEEGGLPVRFNLGQQFIDYITNAEFRMRVLAVVGEDRGRVWSDQEMLGLSSRLEPVVVDMNDLAGLTNLRQLNLAHCQLVNLPALGALGNLRELFLGQSVGVVDMRNLAGLTNLTKLRVQGSEVLNLDAVGELTNLETFSLVSVGGVHDISVLNGLVNLRSLSFYETQVRGINQLAGLERLKYLSLTNSGITDMGELQGFNRLETLALEADYLQNVHVLANSPNLRSLSLEAENGDIDINNLAGYQNVTSLRLSAANLQNRFRVYQLPNLQNDEHFAVACAAADADAGKPTCNICFEAFENRADCLFACNTTDLFCRACLQQCNPSICPLCREPLGILP